MPRFVKTFTFLMYYKYGKLYARLNNFLLDSFAADLNEWQKCIPAGQLICICFHSIMYLMTLNLNDT